MCGIVGVWSSVADATELAYAGLASLQHRGHEAWGIAAAGGPRLETRRELGMVRWDEALASAAGRPLAIGHTRYSTSGGPGHANAQPLVAPAGGGPLAIAHNGNVTNARPLRRRLEAQGHAFGSTSDSEVILALLARAAGDDPVARVAEAVAELSGAFSVVAIVDGRLVAFRDPTGFRPLVLGDLPDGGVAFASETCALDVLGARDPRPVEPGEVVVAGPGGPLRRARVAPRSQRRTCVVEQVYLARADSRVDGDRVGAQRERLGERLALESPAPGDVVVAIPASGVPAGRGYARASGLPLVEALVRNEYVGRTFIQPTPALRELALRIKFNLVRDLAGLRLVVVDDSIVRGSTMRQIVRMLRDAGAAEVHVRIAAPPLVAPCHFGVDIGDPAQLIARTHDLAGVRDAIGACSLEYLSIAGLRAALGAAGRHGTCEACLGDPPGTSGGAPARALVAVAG